MKEINKQEIFKSILEKEKKDNIEVISSERAKGPSILAAITCIAVVSAGLPILGCWGMRRLAACGSGYFLCAFAPGMVLSGPAIGMLCARAEEITHGIAKQYYINKYTKKLSESTDKLIKNLTPEQEQALLKKGISESRSAIEAHKRSIKNMQAERVTILEKTISESKATIEEHNEIIERMQAERATILLNESQHPGGEAQPSNDSWDNFLMGVSVLFAGGCILNGTNMV